jgi:hypothetical protein
MKRKKAREILETYLKTNSLPKFNSVIRVRIGDDCDWVGEFTFRNLLRKAYKLK